MPVLGQPRVTTGNGYQIINDDCVRVLSEMEPGSVDLVFCDPPYNIGYDAYDAHDDNMPPGDYLDWCHRWLYECVCILKFTGCLWVAMGDEYVSEVDTLVKNLVSEDNRQWSKRSHVVWYYTFGVNCPKNFSRSHTRLLYYAHTDSKRRTFNFADSRLRIPSARQLIYNDKRATIGGKLPDNTWVISPVDLARAFTVDEDTWLESRVCGTFKERKSRGEYGVVKGVPQMPVELMARIIRATSNTGDLVVDPFVGTGSTGVAAIKLARKFIGIDKSKTCCKMSVERIVKGE